MAIYTWCLVVHRQLGREGVGVAELLLLTAEGDGLFGRLGARHELGLAGRQRDGGLLLAAPGYVQEMAALLSMKTKPAVECFTAQSEPVKPWSARSSPSLRS